MNPLSPIDLFALPDGKISVVIHCGGKVGSISVKLDVDQAQELAEGILEGIAIIAERPKGTSANGHH